MSSNIAEELQASSLDEAPSVEQLKEVVITQSKQIDELAQVVEEQQTEIEQLKEEQTETRRQQAEDRKRISDVEDRVEDVNPTPDGSETTLQEDEKTPIEQLSTSEDVAEVTDSVSVKRAVSLFKNMADWGVQTPKGICLRHADNPLRLLEADRDESLAWKQYYRAAQVLEKLSKGAVTFFDSDRHGKMLVLHKQSELYQRVTSGALTSSSVGGTA